MTLLYLLTHFKKFLEITTYKSILNQEKLAFGWFKNILNKFICVGNRLE